MCDHGKVPAKTVLHYYGRMRACKIKVKEAVRKKSLELIKSSPRKAILGRDKKIASELITETQLRPESENQVFRW